MRLESPPGKWREDPAGHDCERVAVLISRQIDGELAPSDARELRLHLAVCSICRHALDAQTQQSRMLAESLSALWKKDDRAEQKKKDFAALESARMHRSFSKTLACGALAAGLLFFAATVSAPSTGSMSDDPTALSVPLRDEKPAPHVSVVAQPESPKVAAAPVQPPESSATVDTADTPDDSFEPVETIPAVAIETKPATAVKAAPPEQPKRSVESENLAMLSPSAPLVPLSGVSLNYSGLTSSGAQVNGRVTVLGDVLHGKGVVRVVTNRNEIFESAQADIETALAEPHRSAARRLLKECTDAQNRKRIEQAIQKASE